MKNALIFIFFISLFAANADAQNVPNGGFENWISLGFYENPISWYTTDSLSMTQGNHSVTKETVDYHTASFAMRLTPFTYNIAFVIPGVATNGRINLSTLVIEGGTPDTVRHAQLNGWYKYAPVGNDSCTVQVTLYKMVGTTRTVVAAGVFGTTAAASVYTPFQINLTYASGVNPDSVVISVASSALGSSHIGSVLLVDDFSFSGIVASTNDMENVVLSVNVFPVPAKNNLTVQLDLKRNIHTSFEISDVSGRVVIVHEMNATAENIDISELSNGTYFYSLHDEKGSSLVSGKFSVNR